MGRLPSRGPRARRYSAARRHLCRVSGGPCVSPYLHSSAYHHLELSQSSSAPATTANSREDTVTHETEVSSIVHYQLQTGVVFTDDIIRSFTACHTLSPQTATASTGCTESGVHGLVSSFSPGIVLLASAHLKRLQDVVSTVDADSES